MIAVIGDVHGCFHTLVNLYNKIKIKYKGTRIYCVGDLVDRGRYSFEVMNFIMEERILFTPGNHDYMFADGVLGLENEFAKNWVYNGMVETIDSYRGNFDLLTEHAKFIKQAPLFYNLKDCFISHAGISIYYEDTFLQRGLETILKTDIYDDLESSTGVLWTRMDILNIGKLQIIGHTKHREIEYDQKANAVFVDTGCYHGNKLSAVIVDENRVIDVMFSKTEIIDISI